MFWCGSIRTRNIPAAVFWFGFFFFLKPLPHKNHKKNHSGSSSRRTFMGTVLQQRSAGGTQKKTTNCAYKSTFTTLVCDQDVRRSSANIGRQGATHEPPERISTWPGWCRKVERSNLGSNESGRKQRGLGGATTRYLDDLQQRFWHKQTALKTPTGCVF